MRRACPNPNTNADRSKVLLLISRMPPELGAPEANASISTCVPTSRGAFVGGFDFADALVSDGAADDDNDG